MGKSKCCCSNSNSGCRLSGLLLAGSPKASPRLGDRATSETGGTKGESVPADWIEKVEKVSALDLLIGGESDKPAVPRLVDVLRSVAGEVALGTGSMGVGIKAALEVGLLVVGI